MNVSRIHLGIPSSSLEQFYPTPYDFVKGDYFLPLELRNFHSHLLCFADSNSKAASSILEENSRPYFRHREAGRMLKMNRKKNAVTGNSVQIGTVPRYTIAGKAAPNRDTGIRIKEYRASFVVSLRYFSSCVPSCDGDKFALFLLRNRAHHNALHDLIYKSFPVKNLAGLTTYAGSLMGEYTTKCLEHSIGPGAVSCSFQLQENGFFDGTEGTKITHSLSEECRMTVFSSIRGTESIDAGGVKAGRSGRQAHQGLRFGGFPPESLSFGTCVLNSSRGVKKLE